MNQFFMTTKVKSGLKEPDFPYHKNLLVIWFQTKDLVWLGHEFFNNWILWEKGTSIIECLNKNLK